MAGADPHRAETMGQLLSALDEARALLGEFAAGKPADGSVYNPAGLLQQCLDLCAQTAATSPEPVRILHHFACTGGTLISKCLAAMPNIQLLSEVDPLSTLQRDGDPRFAPTDMARLLRQSSRGAGDQLLVDIFNAGLELIEADCQGKGQRLVLRDHVHSYYCHGDRIPERPNLRQIVAMRFPTLSALTVRHPLDSYLSLLEQGWATHEPAGLDEYCRRYLVFLDAHADMPVMRYEDFVAAPQWNMRNLCSHLRLQYVNDFIDLFDAFQLSGDSGRSGSVIEKRLRRPVSDALMIEIDQSPNYLSLLHRLQYKL